MGITAIPFAVDIEKVKSIFAAKDKKLLEAIKSAEMYEHYSCQSNEYDDDTFNYDLDRALEDIIFNYIKPEDRKPGKKFLGLIKSE